MRNNEIETGNNEVKLGNNEPIGQPECCFGPDGCFRPVQRTDTGLIPGIFLHDQPEFLVQYCGNHCFVSGYLMQSTTLQQAHKSTQACRVLWSMLGTRCYPQPTTCAWLVSGCTACSRRRRAFERGLGPQPGPGTNTPAPTLPCSGLHHDGHLFIILEHGTDMPDPKSLQVTRCGGGGGGGSGGSGGGGGGGGGG